MKGSSGGKPRLPERSNYTRNVGYKTGAITYEFETKTFNYDIRGIRLFADVMDVEEAGVNDCFVEAGAELQRTQVAPEADAFTFAKIASHTGVTVKPEDLSEAEATDILQALRTVTSAMDEKQVTLGSRYLFITPTLKGVLDDCSYANPTMSNRVLERFARVIEVPQARFYTKIDLKSGESEFGYAKAAGGADVNFMFPDKRLQLDAAELSQELCGGRVGLADAVLPAIGFARLRGGEHAGRGIRAHDAGSRAFGERDDVVDARHAALQEIEQGVGGGLNRRIAAICGDGILPSLCRNLGFLLARISRRQNAGALCDEIEQFFFHVVPPSVRRACGG